MKRKICVLFGGMSTEHEVSIASASSVILNLDREKYDIFPVYIGKDGIWRECNAMLEKNVGVGESIDLTQMNKVENEFKLLKSMDVIFPVIHGRGGEDGSIQGMLELIGKPFVGCGILGSSICMDKAFSKVIFEQAKIEQAKYISILKNQEGYVYVNEQMEHSKMQLQQICELVVEKLGLPIFIKPANCGSSIGINKAKTVEEVKKYIEYASQFDKKIIIEESIDAREIECAVLGNEEVKTSGVGEVISASDFYDYNSKYYNCESRTVMPAEITEEQKKTIKKLAEKAYKATECRGLARVDFFINRKDGRILINEINTMPGFTNISMYPKLWEKEGVKYSQLLDELIEMA